MEGSAIGNRGSTAHKDVFELIFNETRINTDTNANTIHYDTIKLQSNKPLKKTKTCSSCIKRKKACWGNNPNENKYKNTNCIYFKEYSKKPKSNILNSESISAASQPQEKNYHNSAVVDTLSITGSNVYDEYNESNSVSFLVDESHQVQNEYNSYDNTDSMTSGNISV